MTEVCQACKVRKHTECSGPDCACKCNAKLRAFGLPIEGHTGPTRVYRSLLGFEYDRGEYIGRPQRCFKPEGLIIWGAPDGATIQACMIGCELQILSSWAPVPTKFFSMGKNYEQVAELLRAGIDPPGWCDWDAVAVGHLVKLVIIDRELKVLGPESGIELVMWGRQLYQ